MNFKVLLKIDKVSISFSTKYILVQVILVPFEELTEFFATYGLSYKFSSEKKINCGEHKKKPTLSQYSLVLIIYSQLQG